MQIYLDGYGYFYGGSETQKFHAIDLWLYHGLEVHLVPLGKPDLKALSFCNSIGCITEEYHSNIFENKYVVNFCDYGTLDRRLKDKQTGKPKKYLWFNTSCRSPIEELIIHKDNIIDIFGFESKFQEKCLTWGLKQIKPFKSLMFTPYFNPNHFLQDLKFQYNRPKDNFVLGRVSRATKTKFSEDTWRIFNDVKVPNKKQIRILGYNKEVEEKVGAPPKGLDVKLFEPLSITSGELYRSIHTCIYKLGGWKENWARVALEAFASGVPFICENNYGFKEMIIDGETGFLCNSSDEIIERASQLAFDEKLRKKIIYQAYDHMLNNLTGLEKCWGPWQEFLDLNG